ncbi:MFS transporter [Arsenicicoccus piscis]|uniref:MFS transporter n=1 Tax=Arsenicicoccus piscis TaxID=673954 RepID=A0ABQ6HUD1_9MICO|nr:MDR family MFS transporter [Arsenicicoccus piscis]MCH8626535.1 MFS transporter [Arsenicicoccus piscis]GMA21180.1 MFS transporter [Arsenicicoccus piscis]
MSSSAASASLAAQRDGELSHRQIVTIVLGLMTGMFLAALDQNIVGTAIRTISDDLHGLDQQAWVTTAYLITSTISTPIYGKLSDLYGRKPFFLAAIIIFVAGSLACTFATSMYMLAAFRAIQGLGAGGLMSLALAIVGDIVPPRERAKYQGYFLAVFGTSSVLGPVIGGFFADQSSLLGLTGWRWVFMVNVPIGAVALFAVSRTLHLHHVRREARIDWWGASMLVLGLVPLLTVAEQGREWGWSSGRSIACFVIGVVGIIGFIWAEHLMKDDALIPLRIFRNRAIVVSLSGGFVVGAGMFGGMMILPQFYLQIINGSSPTKAGLQMIPMVLGMMIASIASGQLMTKTGKLKPFPIFGVALMAIIMFVLSRLSADTPLWQVMVMMFFFGFGLGNTMQPLTLAVQAAVEPRDIGMATSSATFFRQIGGTLGVAIFLSIMFNKLGGNIASAFTDASKDPSFLAAMKDPAVLADPTNASFVKALASKDPSALSGVMQDSSIINHLDPRLAHPFKVGFAQSMDLIFLLAAIACVIGFVVMLFMPRLELGSQSAAAQIAEAARRKELQLEPLPEDASPEDLLLHKSLTQFLVDAATYDSVGHTMEELPDAHLAMRGRHRPEFVAGQR